MCINKPLLITLLLLLTQKAWTGDQKGNGATFVVCPNGVSILDFYENRFQEFSWEGNDVDLVMHIVRKNHSFSPQIFRKFLNYAQSFYSESKFVTDAEIGPISDIGEIKIPISMECSLRQGVLQKIIVFGSEKRYIINKNLWDQLSNVQRAGVILHELLYRELNSKNSKYLRQFNSWLFVKAFKNVSEHEYYKEYKASEFKWTYLHDYPMDAQKIIFDDKPIRSLMSYPNKPFTIFNQEVMSKEHIVDSFPNGKPRSMLYAGSVRVETPEFLMNFCEQKENCRMTLSPEGKVRILNQGNIVNKATGEVLSEASAIFNDEGKIDEIF